ncbi:MAG: RNA 2',3'-cyclic phosphodiesterase [Chloroflexi bacterium]|nr:RNA 2',3'-cyclic phosphodiesterase [Chloroflexota bacterium]
MAQIRAFIAVELPKEIRAALARLQEGLKAEGFSFVKWVDPEGVHLTLKFLGNIEEGKTSRIVEAISSAVEGVGPFRLGLSDLGGFPSLHQPRVIWAGLNGDLETLLNLHRRVEIAMATLGFPKEGRPFTGHLTLGRVRENASPSERRKLGEEVARSKSEGLSFPVNGVSLMRSTLMPSGAIYSRIALIDLKSTLPKAPT